MISGSTSAGPVVSIDGPGGAGKGTVASAIAETKGWHLLDSGALYRIIAVAGLRQGIPLDDAVALAQLCPRLDIVFGALGRSRSVAMILPTPYAPKMPVAVHPSWQRYRQYAMRYLRCSGSSAKPPVWWLTGVIWVPSYFPTRR